MLSGFKPFNSKAHSSDQGTDEVPRGAQSGYTASFVGDTKQVNQAGQFQGLYREHDLQGRFEFVLVF